jgi:hypothetical protein
MTPILPTPDHYLHQLITMTSSEATRLWRKLTRDHVRPRSRGGETITSNIVPACTCCNQRKGSDEWQGWMRTEFGINRLREHVIKSHIT